MASSERMHETQAEETKSESWKAVSPIESASNRFEHAWQDGLGDDARPRIEDFLGTPEQPFRSALLRSLLVIELGYRLQAKETPGLEEYLTRFPADRHTVQEAFRAAGERPPLGPRRVGERLGAYTIRSLLGAGGMGTVYRAWDERRQQEVALKLIRADRLAGASPSICQRRVEQFLREAQAASRLQHPAIVGVLEAGAVAEQPYLAMQLIEGKNLRDLQAEERVSVSRAVELVMTIAEALDYLHQQDLYHCDVKPSNILIDGSGRPYLSDFGLVLDEEQIPAAPGLGGTAAYMSPEQARGEGHLVDGRSDIFSLAVVLYELLGGEHPFAQADRLKTLKLVRRARVVPLRRNHPEIPEELDRICLRALSLRVVDRYQTARDFAWDLRAFLNDGERLGPRAATAEMPLSRIDLQGIAAFGPEDARSYPHLVPGPRTRSGLPVSIAAWLEGIEATVPLRAFRVGLIYGPSGSGKSSLVRAGILPRLSDRVHAVYVDGSRDVETTLQQALRDPCSAQAPRPLPELIAMRRRGPGGDQREVSTKLLVVIDHFEHWLRTHPQPADAELTAALRQCDGVGAQGLLLVREEFRTPALRFLKELDLQAAPDYREALVDLFDLDHARGVLTAMGRSSQALPATDGALTDQHRRFLESAVQLLDHEGRVVPALLAMFIECMRDRPWTAESLTALGDADSLAATFLDDMLLRAVGNRQRRQTWDVVAALLQALLPQTEAEYRRTVREERELFAAAGARSRDEFHTLLESLCATRILTPVESPYVAAALGVANSTHVDALVPDAALVPGETGRRGLHYQLAHDSLLPLVRAWLHLKQRDSWRGRHVQRMTEHAVTWSRRPRSALLPTLSDWIVQWLVDTVRGMVRARPSPTPLHRRMMRAATAYYLRGAVFVVLIGATVIGPLLWLIDQHHRGTQRKVTEILHADPQFLPEIVRVGSDTSAAVQQQLRQHLMAAVTEHASELSKDAEAERRANIAAALCLADQRNASCVWPLLADTPDPRLRTAVIHHLAKAEVEPQVLVRGWEESRDPAVRQALLLALGQYAKDRVPQSLRDSLLARLQADYRTDPDAGVHAAIGWLLRRWGREKEVDELDGELAETGWNQARGWYHTPSGYLMIVVRGPVQFDAGSPDKEYGHQPGERRKHVRIERTFAISATEVTGRQFCQARGRHETPRNPAAPGDLHPENDNLSWNAAAWHCNRVTEQEGLSESGTQLVYVPMLDGAGDVTYDWVGIVKCQHAPQALQRTGYRLPTEEEWEYACRAGTTTSRFFGETELYLDSYAWSYNTSTDKTAAVGLLMPNRLGLFDMLGNVAEWCHDIYHRAGDIPVTPLRGGSAWSPPVRLRAARRPFFNVRQTDERVGFRIARTLLPLPPAVGTAAEKTTAMGTP